MKLLMPSQQGRAADLGARLPILRKHGLSTAHDPLGPLVKCGNVTNTLPSRRLNTIWQTL